MKIRGLHERMPTRMPEFDPIVMQSEPSPDRTVVLWFVAPPTMHTEVLLLATRGSVWSYESLFVTKIKEAS